MHQLTQGVGELGDLDDGFHRHCGQHSLEGHAQRPHADGSTGRRRACRGHASCSRGRSCRQGDKLAIESAQIGNPARDFQAIPGLRHHQQGIPPGIDGLDKGLDGLPKPDDAIGEALGPRLQAAILGHRVKLGVELGQLVLEPGQRPVLCHHAVELGQVVLGVGDEPREQAHVVGRSPARLGGNLVHQGLDGVTAELAGFRELLQLGGVLAGDLLQQLPHRYPALDKLQDLLPLQFLLGPGLAEGQGDALHLLKSAAQFERLIDDALHGAIHGVDAKGFQTHEDLGHLVKLQRGVLGKVLDPGAGLQASFNGAHHRLELNAEAFGLIAGLEHGHQLGGKGLDPEPGTGHGHQAAGQATDGPLEAASALRSLHQGTPQPFGLGCTLAQLPLQALLFLGKVAGIEPGLGEPDVQAGMGGGLGNQLALQLLDLGCQQPFLVAEHTGLTSTGLLLGP
ncbi:hypothetical protein D3C72_500830 [compost metagenome]